MTTIAYRGGIMASDTMASWSGDLAYGVPKMGRTPNYLVGFAGSYCYIAPMFDWLTFLDQQRIPLASAYKYQDQLHDLGRENTGMTMLVASRDGSLWYFTEDGAGSPLHGRPYEAVGSGARFALGAMFSGADCRDAVHAAIHHDDSTGGEVVWISFDDPVCEPFSLDIRRTYPYKT